MRKFIWLSILLFFAPICAFGEVNCTEDNCASEPGCGRNAFGGGCQACGEGFYSSAGDETCSECTKPAIPEQDGEIAWLDGYTGMTKKDACPWQFVCDDNQQANCAEVGDGWSCSCGDCYGGSFKCIFNNGDVDCNPTSVDLYCKPSKSITIKLDYNQEKLDELNGKLEFVKDAPKFKVSGKTSKEIVVYYPNVPVGDGAQWYWYYIDEGANNSNRIPTVADIEGETNDNLISVARETGDRLYIEYFFIDNKLNKILSCEEGECYFNTAVQSGANMTQSPNEWLMDKLEECADDNKESCEITLTANWAGRPMKVSVPYCPSDSSLLVEIEKNFMDTTINWNEFYSGIAYDKCGDISTLCSGVKTVRVEQFFKKTNKRFEFELNEDDDAYKIKIPPTSKDNTVVEIRLISESCPAGEYCEPQNSVPCKSVNCPEAFTSDKGASKKQDCYIDPNTKFIDRIDSKDGFTVGEEKFYYSGTGQ